MSSVHYEHRHLNVACELETAEMGARAAQWQRLREEAGLGAGTIPGGTRLWLRSDVADAAGDLARREARCCGFLDFDLAVDDGRVRLDITSPAPEADSVIACLTGTDPTGVLPCC